MTTFQEKLNEQIAYEFAASQQYIAIAVHYDAQTLPQLAAHFYRQAVEERNHAMMMVQYLLDSGDDVIVPGGRRAADGLRRRRRAGRARARAGEARHRADLAARRDRARGGRPRRASSSCTGSSRSSARRSRRCRRCSQVVERLQDNVMLVEDYLARESGGENAARGGCATRCRRRALAARGRASGCRPSGRASSSTSRARSGTPSRAQRGSAVLVYVPHTTAGVTINEHADPAVARDFETALERIVPVRLGLAAHRGGRGERADAHPGRLHGAERARSRCETTATLALGTWQGIFFCEFDGPRERSVLRQRPRLTRRR